MVSKGALNVKKEYINYPKKVNNKYYDIARKDIIEYFSEDNNLSSIYEYGTVRAPGVSDIDIMLVFNTIPDEVTKYSFKGINKEVFDLVANGNVIKMTKSMFSCLKYVDQFQFKLLSGTDIEQNCFPDNLLQIRDIISICDWLPERIKRIELTLSSSVLNVAHTLCLLHSITYSIKTVQRLTHKIYYSDELFELISSLRENWYRLDKPEDLLEHALKKSIEVGLQALVQFAEILITNIPINSNNNHCPINDMKLPLHRGISLTFNESFSYDSLSHYRKNKEIIFSGILASHYRNLAYLPTLISRRLALKLFGDLSITRLDLENKYMNLLYIKASLISDNLIFLEQSKFNGGLIRYGFYS